MNSETEICMTFDQWIDAVNTQVHQHLGDRVRTEELSWDSALWKSAGGVTAVAALCNDGVTAKLSFDGGDMLALGFTSPEAQPEILGRTIAEHLSH
jgi:hypothetical protein